MIRLVFREINNTLLGVGAAETSDVQLKSFDIDAADAEKWLKQSGGYIHRQFVGIEIIPDSPNPRHGQPGHVCNVDPNEPEPIL